MGKAKNKVRNLAETAVAEALDEVKSYADSLVATRKNDAEICAK